MVELFNSWIIAVAPGALYPILAWAYYLQYGRRKAEVRRWLDASEARSAYLIAFHKTAKNRNKKDEDTEPKKQDEDLLNDLLNLDAKAWLLPLAICMLVAVTGTAVCMIFNGRQFGFTAQLESWIRSNVNALFIAGFAGGYVWGLYDILERFRIFNWTPASINSVSFRMVLGPFLGGYVVAYVANPQIAAFLAFAAAAFPASTIRNWMRVAVRDRLNLSDPAEPEVRPMWQIIQGLTPDIIDRLKEAGVTSVAHLANDDPVRLLRRTNIEWKNILDMMDQACLANYVGDAISALRPLGVRGALEMAELYDRWNRKGEPATQVAAALGISEEAATRLARNLANDPVVIFLDSLWYGPAGHDSTNTDKRGLAATS